MRRFSRFAVLAVIASPLVAAAALASGCSGDETKGGSAATSSGSGSASTSSGSSGSSSSAAGSGGAGGVETGAGGAGGLGSGGAGGLGSGGATSGSGGAGGGGIPVPTEIAHCEAQVYECGDLIDNDGDGLLDSQDPDCLGPCDNTEASYYGGIPGQAGPACTVDCYFDNDSGSGNDDCHWSHKCDPNEITPTYYPEPFNGAQCAYDPASNTPGTTGTCDELNLAQSDICHTVCGPLTPNGCDCFGCCELPSGSGKYVWLGSTDLNDKPSCSIPVLADPDKCHPCKPVDACLNTCGTCEICVGKPTLPPECFPPMGSGAGGGGAGGSGMGGSGAGGSPPPPPPQCPPGIQACGLPGQPLCTGNSYCITGCCQDVPG